MSQEAQLVEPTSEEQIGPLKIGSRLRKYEILALVGQGGYASVYRARDTFFQRDVAIKVLHRIGGVTEDMKRRGQAEATFLSKVRHPNIVEVFDADISESGLLFIVMEYLVGRSLWDVLLEHRRLAVEEAFSIAIRVADAVEAAHQFGAIHRDLKPENIYITENNRVKVLDFGIAKYVNDIVGRTTAKDALHGSVLYMSPEHVQGIRVGPRTDIYALGIILYRALAGEHPVLLDLEQPIPWDIASWHVHKMPRPLSGIAPWVPRHASRFISSMIAKDVRDRPESMADTGKQAQAVLERFLAETNGGELKGRVRDLSRPMLDTDPKVDSVVLTRPAGSQSPTGDATKDPPQGMEQSPPATVARKAAPRYQSHLPLVLSAVLGALFFGGATKAYLIHRRGQAPAPVTLTQVRIAVPSNVPEVAAAAPPVEIASNAPPVATASSAQQQTVAATAAANSATPSTPVVRKGGSKSKKIESESERRIREVEEELRRMERANAKGAK